jgi:NodT family efflux transporter outer membrane factor (OMF) lipoprotein
LTALVAKVSVSNQNVKVAEAEFSQARALVRAARAQQFPTVTGTVQATESHASSAHATTGVAAGHRADYLLELDASYEADVWGRIRNAVRSSVATAQASAADLETVRLSMQAEVAADYFALRASDAKARLLTATVAADEKALDITQARRESGVASGADVAQAETTLEATRAQAIDVGVTRAELEHAIAVLVGEMPSTFSMPPREATLIPPAIPSGVPSALLERRSDIAGAERRVAAANADIGYARAAFFPALTLGLTAGFEGSSIGQWLSLPARVWSLGPALAQTLVDGGARKAAVVEREAIYDQTVATYRQTVLTAFQEVEDSLSSLRVLDQESRQQTLAVQAAQRSLDLAFDQYRSGVASYLQVTTAQDALLTNQRAVVQIAGRQLAASVQLVKALGGGWSRPQA